MKNKQLGVLLAKWIIQCRWLVLGASLCLVIGLGLGLKHNSVNSDVNAFFNADNPQMLEDQVIKDKYGNERRIFIALQPKDQNVFTKSTLSAIEGLVPKLWKTPHSLRVDAITNFQYTYAKGDEVIGGDLVENAQEKTTEELAKIRDIAINEPLLVNKLIDPKGRITGINININHTLRPDIADQESDRYVRDLLQEFNKDHPDINTYFAGNVILATALKKAAVWDTTHLMPAMLLIILIGVWCFVRSITATISTFFVILFSLIATLGMTGLAGFQFTSISVSAMTIIITLAVADSVHILMTVVQEMRQGTQKNDAIIESLRINLSPVFITSLTTIVGFLSMNFNESPPFRDLGNITAMGMLAAFVFSIFLLPALLSLFPIHIKAIELSKKKSTPNYLLPLANLIIKYPRNTALVSGMLIIGVSIMALQNEINDNLIKYFDISTEFRQDVDYINDNLTGHYTVNFSIGTGETDGINQPAFLHKLEDFTIWLRQQKEVSHVYSFSDVIKKINRQMHEDSPAFYKIPNNRSEIAQYLFLYEMSLPLGLDLNDQVTVDKSETKVTVTVNNCSGKEILAFNQRAEAWLQQNTPTSMHAISSGNAVMFAHLTIGQVYNLMKGTGLAILFISFVLVLVFRSIKYGLISMIPNIVPITTGFGIWAMYNGVITAGTSAVFGMVLGIVVDDTVHFISKYLRAKREQNGTSENAIRYAFSTVGPALMVTTIVLIAGFALLAQSQINLNGDMATLTAIIIVLALIIDFLLLPAILLLIDGKKEDSKVVTLGSSNKIVREVLMGHTIASYKNQK